MRGEVKIIGGLWKIVCHENGEISAKTTLISQLGFD
jgi:hypothetical protein